MAISYVGHLLSEATATDLCLAVVETSTGQTLSTPSEWQLLSPAPPESGDYLLLQIYLLPSWSAGMSTSPDFGGGLVGYAVFSNAALDSFAADAEGTQGDCPSVAISASTDWIVSFAYSESTPSVTGLTVRGDIAVNTDGSPAYYMYQADTAGASVDTGSSSTYTWSDDVCPGMTIALKANTGNPITMVV